MTSDEIINVFLNASKAGYFKDTKNVTEIYDRIRNLFPKVPAVYSCFSTNVAVDFPQHELYFNVFEESLYCNHIRINDGPW